MVRHDQVTVLLENEDKLVTGAVTSCRSDGLVLCVVGDEVAVLLEVNLHAVGEAKHLVVAGVGGEVGKLDDVVSWS